MDYYMSSPSFPVTLLKGRIKTTKRQNGHFLHGYFPLLSTPTQQSGRKGEQQFHFLFNSLLKALSQIGLDCGWSLIEENCFMHINFFHMLPYKLSIWAGLVAHFGCPVIQFWVKAWTVVKLNVQTEILSRRSRVFYQASNFSFLIAW